ncbi:LuxR C-terminal-related transcriptional regulator [Nonomuraea sp. NPDC050790]|uniref:helix-turn-helix transcriptional regulator n=1 Tax=Nonomuraea sp. NPDC050790 TaxID=3364371 RepID=UPI0037B8A3C1
MTASRSSDRAADPLEPEDYRGLCHVLDAALGARDRTQFYTCVEHALSRRFGWDAVVFPQPEPRCLSSGANGRDRMPLRPGHSAHATPLAEVVAVEARLLLVIVTSADRGTRARKRAILSRLGRYLAPILRRLTAEPALVLTRREREVAGLVAAGMTNHHIAEKLHVTLGTVKKHLSQAMAKNGCASRTQLALRLHGPGRW